SQIKSGQRFARIFFARRGEGRRKSVALQGRQRSIAENRPQRLSIFYLSLVLFLACMDDQWSPQHKPCAFPMALFLNCKLELLTSPLMTFTKQSKAFKGET
ncbi:MAG: hypothetical protein U0K87_10575, partial [Ruminococcus sp.]|nr:hypothetical protein [Ruminococcus sp.]